MIYLSCLRLAVRDVHSSDIPPDARSTASIPFSSVGTLPLGRRRVAFATILGGTESMKRYFSSSLADFKNQEYRGGAGPRMPRLEGRGLAQSCSVY